MSAKVESKVYANGWHHPNLGKGADGRSVFMPTMQYAVLEKNRDFKEWISHYRGPSSVSIGRLTVHRIMVAGDLASPSDFIKLNLKEAKQIVKMVYNDLRNQGCHQAARQTLSYASNFYNFHNSDADPPRVMVFRRNEREAVVSKRITFEFIPHNADVYKLADVAAGLSGYADNRRNRAIGLRNKSMILFLWQSGIRANCLCNLKYRHVKNYIESGVNEDLIKHEFSTANLADFSVKQLPPLWLKVTPDLDSKIGAYGLSYYVTFLHDEAFKALKEWLAVRRELSGKPIGDDEPLFTPFDWKTNLMSNKAMTTHGVLHELKVCAARAGIKKISLWTHCLRKSFRKVLRLNPLLDDETREILMGHKLRGSQGNYFDFHDVQGIAKLYNSCDWSPSGAEQLNKELEELKTNGKNKASEIDGLKTQISDMQERIDTMIQRLMVNTTVTHEKDGKIYEVDFGDLSPRKNPVIVDRRVRKKEGKKD